MADAVRGDLVRREDEVLGPWPDEPRLLRPPGDELPHLGQRVAVEDQLLCADRRVAELIGEGRGDSVDAAIAPAVSERLEVRDEGVGPLRLLDDLRVERRDVVRAEEPERRRAGKREVEERFVPMALGELGIASPGPDRLTDPADRLSAGPVFVHELPPGRDDARRVRADLRHVGEEHTACVLAQRVLQAFDLLCGENDEDRLSLLGAGPYESEQPAEELLRVPVEKGLVDESLILVADCDSHQFGDSMVGLARPLFPSGARVPAAPSPKTASTARGRA